MAAMAAHRFIAWPPHCNEDGCFVVKAGLSPPPDRSRARRLAALSGAVSIPRSPYFGLVMLPPVSGAGRLLDQALASGQTSRPGWCSPGQQRSHWGVSVDLTDSH